MAFLFKVFISDKIVEGKFQDKYGKDYKLKVDVSYQYQYKSHKVDIGFTKDKKAYWIFKYKGEYYMNILEEIDLGDKYMVIDIYNTMIENAVATLNNITGMQKLKRKYEKK